MMYVLLSLVSVAVCIVSFFAPVQVRMYATLTTPAMVLSGMSAKPHVAHSTLLLWAAFSLVCLWALDSMLWHNKCSHVIARNNETATLHGDAPTAQTCDDYTLAIRLLVTVFTIFTVWFVCYLTIKVMREFLIRTTANVRRVHNLRLLFNAELHDAEQIGENILEHMGFAEFLLFLLCLQVLRMSLHFVALPVTVLVLPLAYLQGLNVAIKHVAMQRVTAAAVMCLVVAAAAHLKTCDDFWVDMSSGFAERCEGERVGTMFLLSCLLAAHIWRQYYV